MSDNNGRFSEDWWEHIWIVGVIMQYKMATEQESAKGRQVKTHAEIDDIHQHIQVINKKLDKILEKLNVEEVSE